MRKNGGVYHFSQRNNNRIACNPINVFVENILILKDDMDMYIHIIFYLTAVKVSQTRIFLNISKISSLNSEIHIHKKRAS